jgi:hypothetical protein
VRGRCHLVYALAPERVTAREANDLLNEYVSDPNRGLAVFHDHFATKPHGGVAVWQVEDERQEALLADPGPLAGWTLSSHPLVYALTATGFSALVDFSLERYAGTSLAELRAGEQDDPRYWWRER